MKTKMILPSACSMRFMITEAVFRKEDTVWQGPMIFNKLTSQAHVH